MTLATAVEELLNAEIDLKRATAEFERRQAAAREELSLDVLIQAYKDAEQTAVEFVPENHAVMFGNYCISRDPITGGLSVKEVVYLVNDRG